MIWFFFILHGYVLVFILRVLINVTGLSVDITKGLAYCKVGRLRLGGNLLKSKAMSCVLIGVLSASQAMQANTRIMSSSKGSYPVISVILYRNVYHFTTYLWFVKFSFESWCFSSEVSVPWNEVVTCSGLRFLELRFFATKVDQL